MNESPPKEFFMAKMIPCPGLQSIADIEPVPLTILQQAELGQDLDRQEQLRAEREFLEALEALSVEMGTRQHHSSRRRRS
jgi:hypothetical protein